MGFFKKLLGLESGKAALVERYQRFVSEGKPALTRQLLHLRLAREQILPFASEVSYPEDAINLTKSRLEQINNMMADLPDAELLGTPEGTIVVTLEQYWGIKAGTKLTDMEVFNRIENLRYVLGAPKGAALPGIDLPTFITRIIRSENPECTPENISDETIRVLVAIASDTVKEFYDFIPAKP